MTFNNALTLLLVYVGLTWFWDVVKLWMNVRFMRSTDRLEREMERQLNEGGK